MVKIISKELEQQRRREIRVKLLEGDQNAPAQLRERLLAELHDGKIPALPISGYDFKDSSQWRLTEQKALDKDGKPRTYTVAEFLGTGDLTVNWTTRQAYEVYAGRDEEPLLYTGIYDIITDPNLPETLSVNRIGPGGVVLEQIEEGGEVKFASLEKSNFTVSQVQYAVGLQYTKNFMKYNRLWDAAMIERQVGIATNALLNHIHLYPIVSASLTGSAATAGSSVGSILLEKYLSTIEDAVTALKARKMRGPYAIITASGQFLKAANCLKLTLQDGGTARSEVISMIDSVIEYDGWTGTRGNKSTTYSGMTDGQARVVSLRDRVNDFRSYVSQDLMSTVGDQDASRFIEEETIWDMYLGAYCDTAPLQKITWPTS